jgi:hypothetical protein
LLLAAELIDGWRGFAAADGPIILTSLEHGGHVSSVVRFVSSEKPGLKSDIEQLIEVTQTFIRRKSWL